MSRRPILEADMAELDPVADADVPGETFAYVDRQGERHLPLNDRTGVRDAIARWNRTHFESPRTRESARRRIVSAARRFGIHIAADQAIARAAH